MIREIEIKKGQETNKLKLMRDLMIDLGIEDLFETVKRDNLNSSQKWFGLDEKIISKNNFKAKIVIEVVE